MLTNLVSLLESANGPSREMDDAICRHFGKPYAPYSESLDCALALVEEKLPGWFWRAGHVPHVHWINGVGYNHWCHLSRTFADHCDRDDEATGWGHTVPNAILLALLRALQSQSTVSTTGGADV
jgi:hypothetical protein